MVETRSISYFSKILNIFIIWLHWPTHFWLQEVWWSFSFHFVALNARLAFIVRIWLILAKCDFWSKPHTCNSSLVKIWTWQRCQVHIKKKLEKFGVVFMLLKAVMTLKMLQISGRVSKRRFCLFGAGLK